MSYSNLVFEHTYYSAQGIEIVMYMFSEIIVQSYILLKLLCSILNSESTKKNCSFRANVIFLI